MSIIFNKIKMKLFAKICVTTHKVYLFLFSQIRHYGAMWSRDCYFPGNNYFVEEHFNLKTSSLVPGQPKLKRLASTADEWNESHPPTEWKYDYTPYPVIIQWEQPPNLLVADTRDTFVSLLFVITEYETATKYKCCLRNRFQCSTKTVG